MPEMVFNKFHGPLYVHGFMKSLLGLMWKPNYENIPQALQFNCDLHKAEPSFACSFIQCPPLVVGWGRIDDHCFVGTFLGVPLSLHHLHSSSSLTGECPTLSAWIQQPHHLGTETQWNHWIPRVNCKAALAAHPRRTSWSRSLPPPLPPQSIPALMTAFLWSCAKIWKTWSRNVICLQLQSIHKIFTGYI